jgi:flagellin
MRINTNVSSMFTRNYLNQSSDKLNDVMERLASGSRINSAKDDAAGLAISTRMTSQISGMEVANRNVQDGISMLQTAEGGLETVTNILHRMRELAVQADNGTNSTSDITALDAEFDALTSEIDNIAGKTEFNGKKLLDGTLASVDLHIGQGSGDTMTVNLADATSGTLLAAGADITTDAQTAISTIDTALDLVSTARSGLGASMSRLEFTSDNLTSMGTNLSAARSRIADADMAKESSELTKQRILNQSSLAMLSQANQQPQSVLSLLG